MKKKVWILSSILIGLVLLSCCAGRYELSLKQIFYILIGQAKKEMDKTLFYQIRLSRTFFVLLAGGALSLSGMVYQSIFHNPLVSPDVLGVSSGCSIGAILTILYCGQTLFIAQGITFFFGIGTVFLTITLAHLLKGERRYMLVLSGIVISSLANSVIMTLKYTADPTRQLPAIEYWLMGSFQHTSWNRIAAVFPILFIAAFVLYLIRWNMKVLVLGEEEAMSLGISVLWTRTIALICATILVAAIVSVAGVISWIGLIAPHIVRLLFSEDFSANFFPSILMGGILLLLSDILARTLFTAEIPISILTSFLGAFFFGIYLFFIRYKK